MVSVEKTTTGVIIRKPTTDIKKAVLKYFSLLKPTREYFIYSGNDPNGKALFGDEKDVIYITSGFLKIKDPVIQSMPRGVVKQPPMPAKIELNVERTPRSQLQRDCIEKLTKSPSAKITVELKTGTGKTFIAMYSIAKLGYKTLIVAPTTLLKKQWVEEFVEAGIDEKDIARNIHDAPAKKICVVTISAIENELRDNWYGLLNILKESNFGIKIIDEAHLHLKGVLKFDAICNIKHNWYLSATLGRSDESEDSILNRALLDADRFIGSKEYEEYTHTYVNVYFQDIWYNPSQKLCNETFKFGSKGLVRSTYYNMLMQYKNGIPFISNIITLIKRVDALKTYKGKTLVLLPLLETIDVVMQYVKNDPYFRKFTIGTVDGSMSLSARRDAMESDLIFATSMSMGTGVDVQNLAAVVNFDQYSSPIINEQIVGRLRDRGKDTWYVDICDHVKQARSIENWGRKRRNLIPYFPGVKPEIKLFPKIVC